MIMLIQAIARHLYLAMTLKHDGQGLPREKKGVFWVLCLVYIASSAVRGLVVPDGSFFGGLLASCIALALFNLLLSAQKMAAAMLVSTFISIVTAVLLKAGMNPTEGGLHALLMLWEMLAVAVLLFRISSKQR